MNVYQSFSSMRQEHKAPGRKHVPKFPRDHKRCDKFLKDTYRWLYRSGFEVEKMSYRFPYDLLVNGKRVEVKEAKFSKQCWTFNIHRHAKLDESHVDVYILRLKNVPGFKASIHLIIPAPLKTKVIRISMRSLLTRYGIWFNNFKALEKSKTTVEELFPEEGK